MHVLPRWRTPGVWDQARLRAAGRSVRRGLGASPRHRPEETAVAATGAGAAGDKGSTSCRNASQGEADTTNSPSEGESGGEGNPSGTDSNFESYQICNIPGEIAKLELFVKIVAGSGELVETWRL